MTKTLSIAKANRLLIVATIIFSAVLMVTTPFFAHAAVLERELQMGMSGTDVSALQTFLAKDPTIYPQGLVTGYFGSLTKSAVSNFQARNGISNVGRVGPQTLPVLNAQMANGMIGGTDVSAPNVTGAAATVSSTGSSVSWNTSENARAKLYYSTSPIRLSNLYDQTGINSGEPTVTGTAAPFDGVARMAHSISVGGLTPNTTYYYQVVALDSANNVGITLPASFRTAQ